MRPMGSDAAPYAPRSRKSSLTDNHRDAPNLFPGPPTTFFMATEERAMGMRTSDEQARPDAAAVNKTPGSHFGERRLSLSEGRQGSTKDPTDCVYGVQSMEDALGEAFEDTSKESKEEAHAESSNGGLAALLGLKRRKTITGTDGSEQLAILENTVGGSPEAGRHLSPRDTPPHHDHTRRSSGPPTISRPLTPLQLESPTPYSAVPSTPKSGSFRSLHLSDEDEGTEDITSQAVASSEEEDDYQENHSKTDMSSSLMPELVMPSLSMPARRPFTAKGKQMGKLKVCVAGPAGKSGAVASYQTIVI